MIEEVRLRMEVWSEVSKLEVQIAQIVARRDGLVSGALLGSGHNPGLDGFSYSVDLANHRITRQKTNNG